LRHPWASNCTHHSSELPRLFSLLTFGRLSAIAPVLSGSIVILLKHEIIMSKIYFVRV
jgi:hypothetical protein